MFLLVEQIQFHDQRHANLADIEFPKLVKNNGHEVAPSTILISSSVNPYNSYTN